MAGDDFDYFHDGKSKLYLQQLSLTLGSGEALIALEKTVLLECFIGIPLPMTQSM